MVKEIVQVIFGMAIFINAALFIPQAVKILRTILFLFFYTEINNFLDAYERR